VFRQLQAPLIDFQVQAGEIILSDALWLLCKI